jgi:hypothetical protein
MGKVERWKGGRTCIAALEKILLYAPLGKVSSFAASSTIPLSQLQILSFDIM